MAKKFSIQPPTRGAFSSVSSATPPPAKPQPGITGNPPLPGGKVVKVSNLTPREVRELGKAIPGWTVEDDLPQETPEIISKLRAAQEDLATVEFPVPEGTPAIKADIREIGTLSPEQQARVKAEIAQALAVEQADRNQAQRQMNPLPSDVERAVQETTTTTLPRSDPFLVDDRTPPEAEVAPAAPTPAAAPSPAGDSGLDVAKRHCAHCGWDQEKTDDVEVLPADMEAYLPAVLGGKPFEKVLTMGEGRIQLTVRELKVLELDTIYQQAAIDANKNRLLNAYAYQEAVDRYRMCLQLRSLRTPAVVHDLPDGLNEETNAQAEVCWDDSYAQEGETPLWGISRAIFRHVLPDESLARAVANAIRRFNRLMAKMEAQLFTEDFSKPTELQP